MKKYFLLFVAAIGLLITSCSKDDDNFIDPVPAPVPTPDADATPAPEFVVSQAMIDSALQVIFDKNTIVNVKEIYSELVAPEEMANRIFGPKGANGDEEMEKAREAFMANCEHVADSIANQTGENGVALFFHNHKFNYQTVDENNQPLTLSAFMCWGCYWWGGEKFMEQDHIVFVCPYTHSKWDECATESNGGLEKYTMRCDNLFIIPDGQGFGVDKEAPQTYLAHNLHAQQYYDCLVAADRTFREKGGTLRNDWDLHVVGASQGGGDAVSLHKYLDTHDKVYDLTTLYNSGKESDKMIADEICDKQGVSKGTKIISKPLREIWRFAYSYVAVGPYSPEATLMEYLNWRELSFPCVLPMVLKTMLAIHPELASKYDEERFYSDIYNKHKQDFDEVILKKTLDTDAFNALMRKKLALDNEPKGAPEKMPIDRILSKEMLDTNSEMCQDMMAALRQEDLTSGWTPSTKCYMYTCNKDEVVPYKNSELLNKFLRDTGYLADSDESWATCHVDACRNFFLKKW